MTHGRGKGQARFTPGTGRGLTPIEIPGEGNEDENDDLILIKKLHPSVQARMVVLVTCSPFKADPEDLIVDLNWCEEVDGYDSED